MDNTQKYIVFKINDKLVPKIFSYNKVHSEVASSVGAEVVSAGFVQIEKDKVKCWGYSTSLQIGSRHEDDELLRKFLFQG